MVGLLQQEAEPEQQEVGLVVALLLQEEAELARLKEAEPEQQAELARLKEAELFLK